MRDLPIHYKKILNVYAMIAVAAIMMCIPYPMIMLAGVSLTGIVWIFCYIYKYQSKAQTISRHHYGYMIKTMWLSMAVALVSVFIFGSVVYFNGDLSPIQALMQQAERGVIPNETDIAVMNVSFIQLNKDLIIWTALATLPIYPLFILFRVLRGARRLIKEGVDS